MDVFEVNNIKRTKQRIQVYNIIENKGEISLKEIINELKDIDKSTIYRIIEFFLNKNIIDKKLDESKNIYYILHENKHVHYINCNICHKKEVIPNNIIEKLEREVLNKNFIITSHNIEFRGICKDCKRMV